MYGWGFEQGYVKGNPCKGVRKFTAKPRTVYITDEIYADIYEHGIAALKIAMEIAYLCAARAGDVVALDWCEILDNGIFIEQNKTGTKQIKEYSPRLRAAVQLARNTFGDAGNAVILGANGETVTVKTPNNWWLKAKRSAEQLFIAKYSV